MVEVEDNLSELKKSIFSWPTLTRESREGLEPLRGLIVKHLEEMDDHVLAARGTRAQNSLHNVDFLS